jgi:hypothetical protein
MPGYLAGHFFCARGRAHLPAGRIYLEAQVLNLPGKGKRDPARMHRHHGVLLNPVVNLSKHAHSGELYHPFVVDEL